VGVDGKKNGPLRSSSHLAAATTGSAGVESDGLEPLLRVNTP